MSKFTIEIDTSNAAFDGRVFEEIASILIDQAGKMMCWADCDPDPEWHASLFDVNGNRVGSADLN